MKRLYTLALLILALATLPALAEGNIQFNNPLGGKKKKDNHHFLHTMKWDMEGVIEGAKGKVTVSCFTDDNDEFLMTMQGLTPNTVHTAWLTSSLKETALRGGIGDPPYRFKSNGAGKFTLMAPLFSCPLASWKWVEVRAHPDGNPENLKGSVRVLRLRLVGQ